MKLSRLAAAATVVAVAFAGLTASPAQAAAKPGVVVDYAYHQIKVKPKSIRPYKDLDFSKLRWTSLTASTGYATGVQNVNTCIPDCAAGNYRHTKVKLKFTRVRSSDCRKVFTRVRVTEVKSKRTKTYALPRHKRSGC
ncbi:hypothetical protein ACIBSW_16120 [Actinoplanes sp. NPDC049668]|uniref:hypothetical protein n=1 Tax=unclassified Actinoplanes TaxID=2626549 RepID=UPI0033BBF28B